MCVCVCVCVCSHRVTQPFFREYTNSIYCFLYTGKNTGIMIKYLYCSGMFFRTSTQFHCVSRTPIDLCSVFLSTHQNSCASMYIIRCICGSCAITNVLQLYHLFVCVTLHCLKELCQNGTLSHVIGGSCHKYQFCSDKSFDIFVATNIILSRQKFCRDKNDICGNSRQ